MIIRKYHQETENAMYKALILIARNVYYRLRHRLGFEVPYRTVSFRLGFMTGQIKIPDDFDKMGGPEIEEMFQGGEE